MMLPATAVPDWDTLTDLYDQLASVEKGHPGGNRARILEDAIDLVLDGRCASGDVRYRSRDAVRRAKFLHFQAIRKRREALARRGSPALVAQPPHGRFDNLFPDGPFDPIDRECLEDLVWTHEIVNSLALETDGGLGGHHAPRVLGLLLNDWTVARIAAELGVSRSTIDRCIVGLRASSTLTATKVVAA